MRKIPLTQGQFALVDDEDYAELAQFKWYAAWAPKMWGFYAVRKVRLPGGRQRTESMHRRIVGLKYGDRLQVDHRNHDTLDNRRANLRAVTNRENNENRRDPSPYGVGVRRRPSGRFQAQAWSNGRLQYLGTYDTAEEAVAARRDWLEEQSHA